MPLLPGQTTLGAIRLAAQQRADMQGSQFLTTAEWNANISASYQELIGLLVQKYGNDYYFTGNPDNWYQFATNGTSQGYALPDGSSTYLLNDGVTTAPAVFKLLGVDLLVQGSISQNGWITLKPFTFVERNRFTYPNVQAAYGMRDLLRYRLAGQFVWFSPIPSSGQYIRLLYVPRANWLSDTGTISLTNVVAGNTLTLNGVVFTGVVSGAAGNQFNIGGADTSTATNLVAVINASTVGAVATASNGGSSIITLTVPAGTISWSGSSTFTFAVASIPASVPYTWSSIVDGVNGWEELITIDAAIKAMQKEESDVSVLAAQKGAIIERLEAEAENRDAGAPAIVGDARGRDDYEYGSDDRWGAP